MTTQDPLANPMRAMRRREALKCLATWSGAAVVWTVLGGVPRAVAATTKDGMANDGMMKANAAGTLTFVQISDTHIGFESRRIPTWSAPAQGDRRHQCNAADARVRCAHR